MVREGLPSVQENYSDVAVIGEAADGGDAIERSACGASLT